MVNNPEVAAMALERHFGRRIEELAVHLREFLPKKAEWDAGADDDF